MKAATLRYATITLAIFFQIGAFGQTPTRPVTPKKAAIRRIVPHEGPWIGRAGEREIAFQVKNGVVTGPAAIPYSFACDGDDAVNSIVKTADGAVLALPGGPNGGHVAAGGTISADFSKALKYTGPNHFEAVLDAATPNLKLTIRFKGTFVSPDTASGSEEISSAVCRKPAMSSWTATPVKPERSASAPAADR